MSLPAPPPSAGSPTAASLLMEAVDRRDEPTAARLLRRWVHRNDLASLERFCHTTLSARRGAEASAWLLERIETPRNQGSMPVVSASPAVEGLVTGDRIPETPEPSPGRESLHPAVPQTIHIPDVETVVVEGAAPEEAMEEETSTPRAEAPETGGISDPCVRREVAAIDPWLTPEAPPSTTAAIEAADPVADAGTTEPIVAEGSHPPEEDLSVEKAEAFEAEAEEEEAGLGAVPAGLRGLGRLGSMVWNGLESFGRPRTPEAADLQETIEEPLPSSEPRGVLPPEASLPPLTSSHRPAPSPASLQELRTWLPDRSDSRGFPRAC